MNILVVSREALFPTYGGHREYLLSTIRQLSSLGNKITVVSWGPEDSYTYYENNLNEKHFKSGGDKVMLKNSENFVPLKKALSTLGVMQMKTILHHGIKADRVSEFERYDLVLKNGPDSNTIGEYVAKKYGIPLVDRLDWVGLPYRTHNFKKWLDFLDEKYLPYQKLHTIIDNQVTKFEAMNSAHSDFIYTHTQGDANKISRYLHESKVSYILPFLYRENNTNNLRDNCDLSNKLPKKYFLFYSSQGIDADRAVKFIYIISKKYPKINFIVTGSENFQNLHRENFKIFGKVKFQSFIEILRNSYLVIMPLIESHGIQMKLIRAFSNGKAVLTTNSLINPIDHIMQDEKNVFLNDSPEEFAKRIDYLNDDYGVVEKVSMNSYLTFQKKFFTRDT